YEIEFDGSSLPSGIYFYRMQAENFSDTKKLILIK
ncbi:MAG: peptidase S8, partial [Candidatus Cloacimonadota bacterium]